MLLAILCENTHTTVGCVDSALAVHALFRLSTDRRETEFGYAAKIRQLLEMHGISPDALCGAAIACAVPPMTALLERAAHLLTQKAPLTVGAGIKTGLHLRINDPATLAADLAVTAVAAKECYPLPLCIVDMGTATTVSALDAEGRFIGCAIYPGVALSLGALVKETALLPHIDVKEPKTAIGASTADAMRAGILYGTAGAVDGLIDRFTEALATPPATLVATGEHADAILPHCRHTLVNDPTLALRGLRLVWSRNLPSGNGIH